MKFKVGDKVKYTSDNFGDYDRNPLWGGLYGKLVGIITNHSDGWYDVSWDNGETNSYNEEDLELVKKAELPKPPKFILQYEIDEDPIEEFQTLREVEKRIRELVNEGGHSFKVYEVKKMTIPEVEKKEVISIKGL